MELSRTPDLSCEREREIVGGWLLEGGVEMVKVALRAACTVAAGVRFCQAGANLSSLHLASRAAVMERVLQNKDISSRMFLGT